MLALTLPVTSDAITAYKSANAHTEKASVDELKAQNSYFINGLYRNEEV